MAKLFDGTNRYIVFMQVLALLAGVCFTSPQPEKGPRLLTRSNPAVSKQWASLHGDRLPRALGPRLCIQSRPMGHSNARPW